MKKGLTGFLVLREGKERREKKEGRSRRICRATLGCLGLGLVWSRWQLALERIHPLELYRAMSWLGPKQEQEEGYEADWNGTGVLR